eukprot:m.852294 g.852294  ORF g.852294 m.852294 type:complete len:113 (+) comp23494_c0_seq37:1510-1848(+)
MPPNTCATREQRMSSIEPAQQCSVSAGDAPCPAVKRCMSHTHGERLQGTAHTAALPDAKPDFYVLSSPVFHRLIKRPDFEKVFAMDTKQPTRHCWRRLWISGRSPVKLVNFL